MENTFNYIDDISIEKINELLVSNPNLLYKNYSRLFEPRFSVSQLGISRQELLTWKQKGLIPGDDSSEGIWTRVNFFEFCWIRIIAELRKMGVPLPIIKKLSTHILEPDTNTFMEIINLSIKPENAALFPFKNIKIEEFNDMVKGMPDFFVNYLRKNFNRLVQLILRYLIVGGDFRLFITLDGEYLVVGSGMEQQEGFNDAYNEVLSSPFYSLPINLILDGLYKSDKIKISEKSTLLHLSENEVNVITYLRQEGVKEVRVKMNAQNGAGIALIEVVEEKNINDMKSKVEKLLQKGKYQNIRMFIANGNIVLFEETTQIKVNA